MKLNELVKDLFVERQFCDGFDSSDLSFNELELMKDALMKCDEFKEATEFVIIRKPFFNNNGGEIVESHTVKISEGLKFKNRVYLYNIMQTPELFDPKTIHIPVKNGACITPTQYDPITFIPHKEILLSINVEQETNKKAMHDLLDDILDNPKEYTVKGERGILVRGIFETISNEETETNYDIGELNLDYNNPMYYAITCLDNKTVGNEVFLNIETKYIPVELKDLFLKTFETRLKNISVNDVDSFLNEHKKQ